MSRPISIEEMVRLFKIRHKTSHMLKIDNFSLLKKYQANTVTSSQFDLGGHKWRLIVNPNGCDNGNDHVSLFLWIQNSIDVEIEFEVYVVSQLEAKWHSSEKLVYHPFLP